MTEPSVLRGALCGHTDSVWGLAYSPAHHRLLSCSADGTVRVWDAAAASPALAVFNQSGGEGAWPRQSADLAFGYNPEVDRLIFFCGFR